MQYADVRLRGVRTAVVLVGVGSLHDEGLIARLQRKLDLPVMLVAKDDNSIQGMRAYAQFDAAPYLFALLACEDVEWVELIVDEEHELPL